MSNSWASRPRLRRRGRNYGECSGTRKNTTVAAKKRLEWPDAVFAAVRVGDRAGTDRRVVYGNYWKRDSAGYGSDHGHACRQCSSFRTFHRGARGNPGDRAGWVETWPLDSLLPGQKPQNARDLLPDCDFMREHQGFSVFYGALEIDWRFARHRIRHTQ